MKPYLYFVAPTPEQKGIEKRDFCWTKAGEPLVIGFKCDCDTDGPCGCRRAFSGNESHKGTTVGVIAKIDRNPKDIAENEVKGWPSCEAAMRKMALNDVLFLRKRIKEQGFKEGDRVRIRVEGKKQILVTLTKIV